MPYVAQRTLNAIEDAMRADGGARFRELQWKFMQLSPDAFRGEEKPFRSHLGASILGTECARALFYNWRHATLPCFNSKTLRLFNRGHLEEPRFLAMLEMIGVEVAQVDENGKQYRISFAEGHGAGSGDGKGVGIPDIPEGKTAVLEFKTHGEKSFLELAGKPKEVGGYFTYPDALGVIEAKPEHYIQMNCYAHQMGYDYSLYMICNKNTDHVYAEVVPVDHETAIKYMDRGGKIIQTETPPERRYKSPSSFGCIWCDHKPVCWLNAPPVVNCRTCQHSVVGIEKAWNCRKYNAVIPEAIQETGCTGYEMADYYGR